MKSVMNHSFSQVPSADIPRSNFNRSFGYKTTIDADYLYPVFCDEALPGDTFNVRPSMFARMNTPVNPIMDNLFLDIHFFSVPMRQLWVNFRKFCGEQVDPGDSIDYTIPTMTATATTGYGEQSLFDYFGLPTKIQNYTHSALPIRAYAHIYNEWFRDQNLIDSLTMSTADGPDTTTNTSLQKRGKRHDYFTSALPWLQKGDSVSIPLGTTAPVTGIGAINQTYTANSRVVYETEGSGTVTYAKDKDFTNAGGLANDSMYLEEDPNNTGYPNIRADLSNATAATINELRQAFQIQKLLERDARAGTRYSEIVNSHFGVNFLDVTYRPEFLGSASSPINVHTVPQTGETGTTPQGNLSAFATSSITEGGFTKSFTEHCIVLGIASVRADITYQQGMNRMWNRSTRYDFYWPALAHIGEQSILMKELYMQDPATDTGSTGTADNERVFGYQERYAEYKYKPSMITGKMRSNTTSSLDNWHLSEELGSLPSLNQTFIESTTPMDRVMAVTTEPDFTLDCYFDFQCARPMPIYSVPGLIDHF